MPKRVLNVGQCPPDHLAIRDFLAKHFDVELTQTQGHDDTLAALGDGAFDLVLINRKLDVDYSDGVEIIHRIKADPTVAHVPVMLVTNYAEHHDLAQAAGAERGFGKLEFHKPETVETLRPFLS